MSHGLFSGGAAPLCPCIRNVVILAPHGFAVDDPAGAVTHDAVMRTMQLYGSLGLSNEMPLARMLLGSMALGIADGPTEVHKASLAREVLKEHHPAPSTWPSEHLPDRRSAALAQFATVLEG